MTEVPVHVERYGGMTFRSDTRYRDVQGNVWWYLGTFAGAARWTCPGSNALSTRSLVTRFGPLTAA